MIGHLAKADPAYAEGVKKRHDARHDGAADKSHVIDIRRSLTRRLHPDFTQEVRGAFTQPQRVRNEIAIWRGFRDRVRLVDRALSAVGA
jgi:hypothetical protein